MHIKEYFKNNGEIKKLKRKKGTKMEKKMTTLIVAMKKYHLPIQPTVTNASVRHKFKMRFRKGEIFFF